MISAVTDTKQNVRHTPSLLQAVFLLAVSAMMLADFVLGDAPASTGVVGAMFLMMGLCQLPLVAATRLVKPLRWTTVVLIVAYCWLRFAT